LTWAGGIIAALSLKITVDRTSKKQYSILKGASTTVKGVEGVYQTSPVVTSSRNYYFDGTVTNPSAYPVAMYFNESGSTYTRPIAAGQTIKISKQESWEKHWPSQVEIHLYNPGKSRIKMTLSREQVTTTGSGGLGWKVLGAIGLMFVALFLFRVFYGH
jgi:hypothetical protein